MKTFRIVADSSSLIGLAYINQFELLKELFSEIYIPDAVYNEVVFEGKDEPGSTETEKAVINGWIIRKSVRDTFAVQALSSTLGKGESEVIILYKELDLDFALIDERTARRVAELMDVKFLGVIGLLDLGIRSGLRINKKESVDRLIEHGFRISKKLYKKMFPS